MKSRTAIPWRTDRRNPHGPWHDFWLFRESERAITSYGDLLGRSDAPVRISDDLLRRLDETLKWLPSENPARSLLVGEGLNLYGATVVRGAGARKLSAVVGAWASLFELGPDVMELGHGVQEELGEDEQPATFVREILLVDRDDFVRQLRRLADLCDHAAVADYGYVLHIGV